MGRVDRREKKGCIPCLVSCRSVCVCGLGWFLGWLFVRVMDREVVGIVLVAVGLFVEEHGVFIECVMDRDVSKEGHDEELCIVVKYVV